MKGKPVQQMVIGLLCIPGGYLSDLLSEASRASGVAGLDKRSSHELVTGIHLGDSIDRFPYFIILGGVLIIGGTINVIGGVIAAEF